MEYYSAIKKNEIMPFAATWMDLEILILSEISQRKAHTPLYHLYVESKKNIICITCTCNLKNYPNKFTYKTEIDSQT